MDISTLNHLLRILNDKYIDEENEKVARGISIAMGTLITAIHEADLEMDEYYKNKKGEKDDTTIN